MNITLTINGVSRQVDCSPDERLRDLLQREGFTSARNGCDHQGSCGACTVLLDGKAVNSCLLLAAQVDGKELRTVEGLAGHLELSTLQTSFIDAGMVQCGYCTPAMLMATQELLDRVEKPSREQISDAVSGIFCRCTGYEQLFAAVELAVARKQDPDFTKQFVEEFRDELRVVGKVKQKVDAPHLARGGRAFVDDFVDPDCCHLKVLRSPHAHAYITNIDTSAAEALDGVVFVVTHKNCPDVYYNQAGQGFPEPSPYDRKMFGEKVLHVGDRVAAVVAETEEIAHEALQLIDVAYEVLQPVLTIDQAAAEGAPIVHNALVEYVAGAPDDLDNSHVDPRDGKVIYQFPIHGDPHRNIAASVDGGIGDIEKGFEEAEVVLERVYESSQVQCTPLEPHVIYTKIEADRLIMHASTQVSWHLRRIVASILNIRENQIRVIKERTGGAFGSKQDIVHEEVAAYCTWVTGRSILFRFSREEEFISSRTRHVVKVRVKLGAKKDGKLTAILMDLKANTGPYGSHCLTVPMNACSKSLPLFICDNVQFYVKTYYSNIPPTGAYQGYGAPGGSFALQLAVAELADELGIDHLELVQKNRVHEGSWLEILRCLGEGREGIPQEVFSCGLGPALDRGAKMIDWGNRVESADPDVRIGKGLTIIQQGSGLPDLDSANATVNMFGDGTFMVLSGGADLGTGLDTVCVKMVAECLCTPMSHVSIISGDTDVNPFDVGAYASSGTFFSGGAALNAAKAMKEKILSVAGEILGEPDEDLALVYPSTVKGKSGSVTYHEISQYTTTGTGRGQLSATRNFIIDRASFPYGAHFCQVAVNTKTGKVDVQKYYALQDCGTPINPELATGQIFGGVLKTIGHTLFEEMILDENGRCLNANLLDYKVPMIGDLPTDFRVELIDTNDPFGPYGGKSVSEISCNGASPSIAAAIHDAVGIWIRSWPFSPEKILRALGKLGATSKRG